MKPHLLLTLALLPILTLSARAADPVRVPVIYCTDLFHPHDDFDDHLDLATLFALPELDLKAIILDEGAVQQARPGRIPVEQMLRLTGRKVPYAVGLTRLKSPSDTGRDQPPAFQAGVELILKVLRESDRPVTVITAGSVRDVAAAFNREPALVKAKVKALYVNIGNSFPGGDEYNVDIDRAAYRGLMESDLPVWWLPCFPADAKETTYFRFTLLPEAFKSAPAGLRNFLLYGVLRLDPSKHEPIASLNPPTPLGQAERVMVEAAPLRGGKEMWCTPGFLAAAGRDCYRVGGRFVFAPTSAPPAGAEAISVFLFVPARVTLDAQGKVSKAQYGPGAGPGVFRSNLKVIRLIDPALYSRAMNEGLCDLFARFPVAKGE